jgi:hypothetical protein
MKVVVKNFENEGENKFVGLRIEDENGRLFLIDKRVPIQEGKLAEEYVSEALAACEDEIDEWQNSLVYIGKEFDFKTEKFIKGA